MCWITASSRRDKGIVNSSWYALSLQSAVNRRQKTLKILWIQTCQLFPCPVWHLCTILVLKVGKALLARRCSGLQELSRTFPGMGVSWRGSWVVKQAWKAGMLRNRGRNLMEKLCALWVIQWGWWRGWNVVRKTGTGCGGQTSWCVEFCSTGACFLVLKVWSILHQK